MEKRARTHQSVGSDTVSPGAAAGTDRRRAEARTRRARSRPVRSRFESALFRQRKTRRRRYRHAKNVRERGTVKGIERGSAGSRRQTIRSSSANTSNSYRTH